MGWRHIRLGDACQNYGTRRGGVPRHIRRDSRAHCRKRARGRRDDWVFSLADDQSKKVSGERLGIVYGMKMLHRRFGLEELYRPTKASVVRIREAAEQALAIS